MHFPTLCMQIITFILDSTHELLPHLLLLDITFNWYHCHTLYNLIYVSAAISVILLYIIIRE